MTINELQELFIKKRRTLGSVESFTGGKFAATVTSISGASKYYKGTLVTYATSEKEKLLSIPHERIEKFGVVSQEIGGDMALRGRFVLETDYCIAFTGNAGPTAMENKPVGEVYIAVTAFSITQVFKYNLSGTREEIVNEAIKLGIEHLAYALNQFN